MTVLNQLPPVKIAFISDDSKVLDVLHTDERLAAILLSSPIFIDVTGPNNEPTVEQGWIYNPETQEITMPVPGAPVVED
jgi:hypothetical protein